MVPDPGVRRRIRLLYRYRILSRLYFHLSILFVLLTTQGQNVVAVEAELAVYGLAVAAAGPVVAALRRREPDKGLLVGGELVKAVGLVVLATDPGSVVVAVTAQVVNGFGFGMTSMTDPVVVSAAFEGDSRQIGRFQASSQSLMFLSTLVAGVTGALLFEWRSTAPLWASATSTLVGAAAVSRLPGEGPASPGGVRGVAGGRRPLRRRQARAVAHYALTRGFMLAAFVGVLPFLLYRAEHVGVLGLSLALGAFSVAAFLTARSSQRLLEAVGGTPLSVGSSTLLGASFLCFAFTRNVAVTIAAMMVMGAASGTVRPATMRLLIHIGSDDDGAPIAVVAKRMEGVFGLVNAAVIFSSGVLISRTSFRAGMLLLDGAFVAAIAVAAVATAARPGTAAHHDAGTAADQGTGAATEGALCRPALPEMPT